MSRCSAHTTGRRRPVFHRWTRALVAAAGIAIASASPSVRAQLQWRWPDAARVVVVADVHGAYDELTALLQAAGVVDADLNWSGGATTLVSLGDLLDRGAQSRKVMDLLMRLQRDAAAAGGAVHVVLGNHEAMNLTGDLRYVSPQEYAAFAGDEPGDARAAAYARFAAEQPAGTPAEQARFAFERRYPPGYFAHRAAFGAQGTYGRWLSSLPALIVVGDTAFVHGGLPAMVSATSPADLNARIQDALRRQLNAPASASADASTVGAGETVVAGEAPELGLDGPLWYRGSVYCNAFLEQPVLDAALASLDAARVVVGHTPAENRRARELYDGRLIMLDTGMLADYYSGRPAALIVEDGRKTVQYLAPAERAPLERGRIESDGLTEDEIGAALAQGVISVSDRAGLGSAAAVDVSHAGKVLRALFYPAGSARAAERELAAHALDRLLGLGLVPPTVAREIDGKAGALQLVYSDTLSEAVRVDGNQPVGDWCPLPPQFALMYTFDALTYNIGRTRDNVLYRQEQPLLKLVDHGRAFGAERRVRLPENLPRVPARAAERAHGAGRATPAGRARVLARREGNPPAARSPRRAARTIGVRPGSIIPRIHESAETRRKECRFAQELHPSFRKTVHQGGGIRAKQRCPPNRSRSRSLNPAAEPPGNRFQVQQWKEGTIMNNLTKDNGNQPRKARRFAWIFEEWVFQVALVVAVITVVVDGVLSIGGHGIV